MDENQANAEGQDVLRQISLEELKQILGDHEKWLESDGKEGKKAELKRTNLKKANLKHANLQKASLWRADLSESDLGQTDFSEANLSRANLQGSNMGFANLRAAILERANLRGAYLVGAELQGAYLGRADLREANLMEANFREADLSEAILEKAYLFDTELNDAFLFDTNFNYVNLTNAKGLKEAKLQYANFEKTTGLLGTELMQTNITGTKLPANYNAFNTLQVVEETSKNARKIFFSMLIGCVYSWLTIATTTDVKLLTNSASSSLPIIGTAIPIAWFYWAAPLVILGLYLYFHYYLSGLWEGLSGLPAIFPDGKRLDERAYPWLLNKLVRRHFNLLREKRPLISRQQEWVIIFLAWWTVPFTFIGFWLRYLPRHDWFGTSLHIGLLVVSVAFAIIFYRLCALTLQGKEKIFRLLNFWSDRKFYYGVSVILVGILFSLISHGSINGIRSEKPNSKDIKILIPWAFEKIGYDVFADFRETDVSEKPDNYGEIAKEERIDFVKGAKLKEANLKNANMYKSFLVKADLRAALLNGANLSYAQLQQANFGGAILRQVNLKGANLQQANLRGADLQHANLSYAQLQQANFVGAILHQAQITGAQLQYANLSFAKLHKADLPFAELQHANLMLAQLQHANLSFANLQVADLKNANLQHANLSQVDLQGADLQGTNLAEADLTGVKNVSIDQLSKVRTLYQAKLDPDLMEQVKRCYPHLLDKPK